jgi:hypothetical protein
MVAVVRSGYRYRGGVNWYCDEALFQSVHDNQNSMPAIDLCGELGMSVSSNQSSIRMNESILVFFQRSLSHAPTIIHDSIPSSQRCL